MTYTVPRVSTAIPAGKLNFAEVAGPSTKPVTDGIPANVVTNPTKYR
jgi:hypothetical protein